MAMGMGRFAIGVGGEGVARVLGFFAMVFLKISGLLIEATIYVRRVSWGRY